MATISIIIPVYFNAASLSELAHRLSLVADAHPNHRFEFIYVDDGSGDNSYGVMRDLAAADSRVRLVKLTRNFGSNTAVLAGLTHATGDCAGFVAADLQDPPETISQMLGYWEEGLPLVFAVRKDRKGDPFITRLFANLFNWLFRRFIFKGLSPQGIGFFLADRRVIDFLINCQERNAHIIGLLLWSGYHFASVEYDRIERLHGKSRWTFSKKIKYFIDAFAAFSFLPLRIASVTGILMAFFGLLYAIFLFVARLLNRIQVPGWTALIVVVLLTAGAQLLMLGIIGEYLWRNFDASRKRPLFVVDSLLVGNDPSDSAGLQIPSGEETTPSIDQEPSGKHADSG